MSQLERYVHHLKKSAEEERGGRQAQGGGGGEGGRTGEQQWELERRCSRGAEEDQGPAQASPQEELVKRLDRLSERMDSLDENGGSEN